jgi:NADP-dependent 3-hydroxy acid dehydrogenase YdfG
MNEFESKTAVVTGVASGIGARCGGHRRVDGCGLWRISGRAVQGER